MGGRAAPILHVVHAGRGDAMYLEFETIQQGNRKRHLMAVDGGPRDSGNYHKGGDKSQRQQINHAVHDNARFRQYYKFFASAGKMIYYDDMETPARHKFILSSMVCTHTHEDHVEGLLDMLQHAGRTVELDLGFILPAYLKKNFGISADPANPTKTHVDEVYRMLVEATGKHWYPEKLDRDSFIGGDIVYPPPRDQNHPRPNDSDKEKDLILIRPRKLTDPNIDKV